MRSLAFVLIMTVLFGCVEKNYTPEELAAQSRGNSYHWVFNKALGFELPSGWKLIKGAKAKHYQRITGGTDYVIIRTDFEEFEGPMIGIRAHKLNTALSRKSIREQVAIKKNVDVFMQNFGVFKYDLTSLDYDEQKNLFTWSANYKMHYQQYMYNGLSPSEQMQMQYAGITRYKDATSELHFDSAHFFVEKYEIQFVLADGLNYFSDKPQKYVAKYDDDFQAIVRSVVIK